MPTSQLLCFASKDGNCTFLKRSTLQLPELLHLQIRGKYSLVCSPSPASPQLVSEAEMGRPTPSLEQKEQIPGAVVLQSSFRYWAEAETLPTPSPVWLPSPFPSPLPHPPRNAVLIKHSCRNPISGLLSGAQAKTFVMCESKKMCNGSLFLYLG